MAVTELAILTVLPPHEPHSSFFHNLFKRITALQSAWSGYPLYFFQDAEDDRTIYLISGWKDVAAHWSWIESEDNQSLLAKTKSTLAVQGLKHLQVDVGSFPEDVATVRMKLDTNGRKERDDSQCLDEGAHWHARGVSIESEGRDSYEIWAWHSHKREEEAEEERNTCITRMNRLPY